MAFVDVATAAARLGVSDKTIRRRIKDGVLAFARDGHRVLVRVDDSTKLDKRVVPVEPAKTDLLDVANQYTATMSAVMSELADSRREMRATVKRSRLVAAIAVAGLIAVSAVAHFARVDLVRAELKAADAARTAQAAIQERADVLDAYLVTMGVGHLTNAASQDGQTDPVLTLTAAEQTTEFVP